MRQLLTLAALTIFLAAAAPALADSADAILGRWYTEDDESQVEIFKTKNEDGAEVYSGKLVWFENPVYEEDDEEAGKLLRDRENPDTTKQNDPLLGLLMLENFVYDADDASWTDGTIYDPEKGKTYKCIMRLADEGSKLDVRGYVGIAYFGRTTQWNKVTEENDRKSG